MSRFMRSLRLGLVPGLFVLGLATIAGTAGPAAARGDGWLGVATQAVTEDLRDALDLHGDGVLVNRVVEGSPADHAGIRKGDVITSVNGRQVRSPEELAEVISSQSEGARAAIRVARRGGEALTIDVRLGSRPEGDNEDREQPEWKDRGDHGDRDVTPAPGARPEVHVWKNGKEVDPNDEDFDMPDMPNLRGLGGLNGMFNMRPRLGVRTQKMNSDLGSYFGGTNGRGALVVEVIEGSAADRAGLRAGDVITAVGNANVDDPDDLVRAIANEEGKTSLTIVRRGARRTIEADLGERSRDSDTWRMRDGRAPRAPRAPMAPDMRRNDGDDSNREIQELRDEIRELKKQLQEQKDHNNDDR